MHRLEYTVSGRGRFPLDMLRYDASYPSRSESVAAIEHSLAEPHGSDVVYAIQLHRWTDQNKRDAVRLGITEGRWNSFGWYVSNVYLDNQPIPNDRLHR